MIPLSHNAPGVRVHGSGVARGGGGVRPTRQIARRGLASSPPRSPTTTIFWSCICQSAPRPAGPAGSAFGLLQVSLNYFLPQITDLLTFCLVTHVLPFLSPRRCPRVTLLCFSLAQPNLWPLGFEERQRVGPLKTATAKFVRAPPP